MVAPPRSSGRLFLLLGLALGILGVAVYAGQLWLGWLKKPWYLPATGTLGVLLLVASLWQRRTVWRFLALPPLVLVAGAGWMLVFGAPLPAYKGPVKKDQPFPDFTTAQFDGKPFTQADLKGDKNTVMVFFRGRW
jgi:hypothetical protein